jgi:chondroitin AC lyase
MYRSEYLDVEARAPREKAVLFYGGILLFSLLLLLVSAYMPTQAQADDLATIKARLRATAREGAVADRVTEWARSLDADGAWPDIDYADKARANWSPAQHLSRLQHLARAATSDPSMERLVLRGLDYWLVNDFQCPNWW